MKKITQSQSTLLLLIVTLYWFAQYVYIPFQTPYLTSIHVSSQIIGMIIGAYGISQLILRLPVGLLADIQQNHRRMILIGTLLSGAASLIRIVMANATGFFIANFFSGFASATWISFMVLFLGYYSDRDRSKATGKVIMANNLGMLLGFITSTLLYNILGMQIICFFSVIAGLTAFLLALKLDPPISTTSSVTLAPLKQLIHYPHLIAFSFLALIQQGIQMTTTMSFTSQFLSQLNATQYEIGFASIIYMFSSVIFAQISTLNSFNQLSKPKISILSFLLLAVYCLSVPQANQLWQIYMVQILPGIGTGILFSYITSEAMSNIPTPIKSTAMGLFQAIYAIGMTVFPIIAGTITNQSNLVSAYNVMAIFAVAGALITPLFYKKFIVI